MGFERGAKRILNSAICSKDQLYMECSSSGSMKIVCYLGI